MSDQNDEDDQQSRGENADEQQSSAEHQDNRLQNQQQSFISDHEPCSSNEQFQIKQKHCQYNPIPEKNSENENIKIENRAERDAKIELKTEIQRSPTQADLCECIIQIKSKLPHCKLDEVIRMLHQNLIDAKLSTTNFNSDPPKIRKRPHPSDEDQFLSHSNSEEEEDIDPKKMQEEFTKKFQNSQANPRFYEEREIAKLFCLKGYGYPTARQFLGSVITPNRYNNVITTIVRLSYRKLQYFVIKNCNPNLTLISREELKLIKTPLVNCRNWLDQDEADTFHRFVRLTYKITTASPDSQKAYSLYNSIMNQLNRKNKNFKPSKKKSDHDHSGWTEEMDLELIILYLKHKNLAESQQEIIMHRPLLRYALEINKIKTRLQKNLKLGLRKIYVQRQLIVNRNFPILQPLQEWEIKQVMRSSQAIDARLRILAFYIDKDNNPNKLKRAIQFIQNYLENNHLDQEDCDSDAYYCYDQKINQSFKELPKIQHRLLKQEDQFSDNESKYAKTQSKEIDVDQFNASRHLDFGLMGKKIKVKINQEEFARQQKEEELDLE